MNNQKSKVSLQKGITSSLSLKEKFTRSAASLSRPLTLAVCAMLLSLCLILSYFGNVSITFLGTNVIKLSFTALPIAVAAMLYGPVPAGVIGALSDIIGFMLAPMGAYIPGFTISMLLVGFIYGAAFYNEKPGIPRVALTQLIVSIAINEMLGSLWFVLFYGFTPSTALSVRGIKELIMYPILTALIFGMIQVTERLPEVRRIRRE
ncbi:MAG: folate family ECF transporter S component [Clostridia bacterium]|nr:folate family ECF transporter S component [Clostridia bacterium]